jgi:predicted nucleotidyltransferase component of viral defense system
MIEELLGAKLRALYQRKKGRDLYDLWLALTTLSVDDARIGLLRSIFAAGRPYRLTNRIRRKPGRQTLQSVISGGY